jgi:hypothetical protein
MSYTRDWLEARRQLAGGLNQEFVPCQRTEEHGPEKADADKIRMDLLPVSFLRWTAAALRYGAEKYDDFNYMRGTGLKYSRVYAAALRHLTAWWDSEGDGECDDESGIHHLAHAASCLAMLIHLRCETHGVDDRPYANPDRLQKD